MLVECTHVIMDLFLPSEANVFGSIYREGSWLAVGRPGLFAEDQVTKRSLKTIFVNIGIYSTHFRFSLWMCCGSARSTTANFASQIGLRDAGLRDCIT